MLRTDSLKCCPLPCQAGKNIRSASASDKEKTITDKNITLSADPCVYYSEEQDGTVFKYREQVIGNTVYTVISRNNRNAKATAFDITKRLIERNSREAFTTQSLEGCNSGGHKQ